MALKIYCPGTDNMQDATQADIDRMQRQCNILGGFLHDLEKAILHARGRIKETLAEEKKDA